MLFPWTGPLLHTAWCRPGACSEDTQSLDGGYLVEEVNCYPPLTPAQQSNSLAHPGTEQEVQPLPNLTCQGSPDPASRGLLHRPHQPSSPPLEYPSLPAPPQPTLKLVRPASHQQVAWLLVPWHSQWHLFTLSVILSKAPCVRSSPRAMVNPTALRGFQDCCCFLLR